jgi:hypothetical protein
MVEGSVIDPMIPVFPVDIAAKMVKELLNDGRDVAD